MLESGARVGRYEILERLGRGGMGFVFRARDTDLHRVVALKILREDDVEPGELSNARERFMREARAAAALDHPNVITIFDVGLHGETPYLVMELVRGRTLREAMKGSATTAERISWLTAVARALAAAHEAGLVHRDIKPDNVIIGDDGVVTVLDFGLAKPISPRPGFTFETLDDHAFGTPKYMAPEQLVGARVDAKADQYAWGRMAFEVLTRMLPAPPQELPRLDESAPGVSPRLADLVERTQAKLPSGRMSTMAEIVRVIESLSAEAVPAREREAPTVTGPEVEPSALPPERPTTATKNARSSKSAPRRRWPLFVAAAAPGVAFGTVVVVLVASGNRRPPDPAPSASTARAPNGGDAAPNVEAAEAGEEMSSPSEPAVVTDDAAHDARPPATRCACRFVSVTNHRVYGAMCLSEQDGPCACEAQAQDTDFVATFNLCPTTTDADDNCPTDKLRFVVGRKTGEVCEGFRTHDGRVERRKGTLRCNRCVKPTLAPGKTTDTRCRGIPLGSDKAEDGLWDCSYRYGIE